MKAHMGKPNADLAPQRAARVYVVAVTNSLGGGGRGLDGKSGPEKRVLHDTNLQTGQSTPLQRQTYQYKCLHLD